MSTTLVSERWNSSKNKQAASKIYQPLYVQPPLDRRTSGMLRAFDILDSKSEQTRLRICPEDERFPLQPPGRLENSVDADRCGVQEKNSWRTRLLVETVPEVQERSGWRISQLVFV